MNKFCAGLFLAAAVAAWSTIQAQPGATSDVLQAHLEQAAATLSALEGQASGCLEIEAELRSSDLGCSEFLATLNGPGLQHYLEHCAVLQDWREGLIADPQLRARSVTDDAPRLAELLLQTESLCGAGAMQRHAGKVAVAYRTLMNRGPETEAYAGGFGRTLREQQFNAQMEQERQRLLDELAQQQQRRQQETLRQQDQLEIDRLRRQQDF